MKALIPALTLSFLLACVQAHAAPVDATDDSFESEVAASTQVVVEFWSPRCIHCVKMVEVVESLASEYAGRVKFVRVNVLENRRQAGKFGVQAIPAFFMIHDGAVTGRAAGSMTDAELKEKLGLG